MITLISNWTLLLALAAGEAILMAALALAAWRRNARSSGRVLNYVLGCTGLLAGLGAWAAGTPGPVAPAAAPLVFAALLLGAGAGTCLPRVVAWWHGRRAVAEAIALETALEADRG